MRGTEVVSVAGEGRELGVQATSVPARIELHEGHLSLALTGAPPLTATFRDVTTLAVQQGQLLLVLGDGAARFLLERLGAGLGTLVGELRERRARQLLADRLIEAPVADELELAEYRAGNEHGVTMLAFHGWGAALMPLDERQPWRLIRRADIEAVDADPGKGLLRVGWAGGRSVELLGLGAAVERQRQRWAALREAALGDAANIVAALVPDAPIALRRRAAGLLVDGRPVERSELGHGWPAIEAAVLSEPVFAASYRALAERGEGPRWIALAPARPGATADAAGADDRHVAWFFVALPGNLVAMELVSAGAHATYLFRVVPRAAYGGETPAALANEARIAVGEVSEALIDARFLRAPLYLTDEQLASTDNLRYRLAIAALPSLRAARSRFVGRVIHRDDASWERALDEAIAWNAAARDDRARWPGSAAARDDDDEPATSRISTATEESA